MEVIGQNRLLPVIIIGRAIGVIQTGDMYGIREGGMHIRTAARSATVMRVMGMKITAMETRVMRTKVVETKAVGTRAMNIMVVTRTIKDNKQ